MIRNATPAPSTTSNGALAIAIAGSIAGTLDLIQAIALFGRRVPLVIAAGLLGRQSLHGGPLTYAVGVLLHFFIASTAAAVYYGASRTLSFLTEHPLVCGVFYGVAVELVMNLLVLPLSALHSAGPYQLQELILGLVVHIFTVGLPIAYSIRYFARRHVSGSTVNVLSPGCVARDSASFGRE